jgi:hypothetical protein
MMKDARMVSAVVVGALALVFASPDFAQDREIHLRANQKIADRLTASDTSVVVIDDRPIPHMIEPKAGVSWLQWLTQLSDLVVVAELVQQRPFLTGDGAEVRSALTFQVTEVLKAPDARPVGIGGRFEWVTFGGTVNVGTVKVHARKAWSRGFTTRDDYLLFINVSPTTDPLGGGRLVLNETSMFQIKADQLESVVDNRPLESLTDRSPSDVKAEIRAAKKRR